MNSNRNLMSHNRLKLRFTPYHLRLKHDFNLAGSSRKETPAILTEINFQGITGYGEASMPPYLGETQKSGSNFLSRLELQNFNDPFRMDEILEYVDKSAPGNTAAKASIDIALHDLTGKILLTPWYKLWGISPENSPHTSFTIGMDKPDIVQKKVNEAKPYKLLKIKLGGTNDREMIETIRKTTDKPLCVDVNQGWTDKHYALEMAHWLYDKGVVLIEQPMPKEWIDEHAWLTERSPVPVIADEAVQRLPDIMKAAGVYSGINIKLMKCTGLHEAYKMITVAKSTGLKVMVGCMTETSCAISAAAQLAPLADWADLDGNLLIVNDPFDGAIIKDGKIIPKNKPGIGVVRY